MAVLSRNDRRATWHADRIGAEAIRQPHTFPGKPVEIRCWIQRSESTAIGTDGMRRVIVGHDVQNVRLIGRYRNGSAQTTNSTNETTREHTESPRFANELGIS